MRGRVNFPGLFNKCQTNIKTLNNSKLCSSVENAQTSVMYISDKMLMSFNGWNPGRTLIYESQSKYRIDYESIYM